jgi:murein DD-endopeptidase MepM/ murein hydrolase activator NlpD
MDAFPRGNLPFATNALNPMIRFNTNPHARSSINSIAVLCLALAAGVCPGAPPPETGPAGRISDSNPAATAVKVVTQRDSRGTHFYVVNDEYCEVTMTFDMDLQNLKGNTAFPYTATFPSRTRTEAFELSPIKSGSKWEYSYTNYYKLGSSCARHDDSYIYQLPYAPGNKFKVTQGYNGKFSHKGSNQYAIDWDMPEGTLVHAARGGIVVRIKDDSDKGGPSLKYDPYNNYVLIRHEDGTLGHYCHLQKAGILVKVGQMVSAGDVIAHSGSTGFSSGPHLHFCVFKTKDGCTRISIPVKFRTSQDKAITLTSGHSYRAADIQSASAGSAAKAL